jgi:hypothetical protein
VGPDTCRQEENVFGRSFIINLNLSLTLEFEESNWLPELSVSISFLLRAQPLIVILPLEVTKNIFGNFKPAELIRGKD